MNRAQRRKVQREKPWITLSEDERKRLLFRNGITADDLKMSYDEGAEAGKKMAVITCYAAVCMMLKEKYGADQDAIVEALRDVDDRIVFALGEEEAREQVYREIGIRLDFKAPMERIVGV